MAVVVLLHHRGVGRERGGSQSGKQGQTAVAMMGIAIQELSSVNQLQSRVQKI